ncbi:hypothetical protein DPMN_170655 [Dreissena polymorpha]|uniref:Uncharacterized protein n=1 Tax=Dreissena polymorpha TaxID=45954 RepID=A0A9D4DXQ7_DREPO|nr:hypothetical protein DPMN_170655 [Dreissena polymorpha]
MCVAGVVPRAAADYRCLMFLQVLYLEQLLTTDLMFVAGAVPRAAADYRCLMCVAGVVPRAAADYRSDVCCRCCT